MTQTDTSADQARAQFESIAAMVARLTHAQECTPSQCPLTDEEITEGIEMVPTSNPDRLEQYRDMYHDADEAAQRIQEDALSVQVRTGWHTPNEPGGNDPAEFEILLCTGGPAVRIVGDLDQYAEPYRARLEHQDWGTPWTEYRPHFDPDPETISARLNAYQKTLLGYCRQFYFGV
jgi:hypothetical protein